MEKKNVPRRISNQQFTVTKCCDGYGCFEASQQKFRLCNLYVVFKIKHVKYICPFNTATTEWVQWRAMKIMRGQEHLSCEKRLRDLGLLSLEKRQLRRGLFSLWNTESPTWTPVRTLLWGWLSTGTECPDGCSKGAWRQSWVVFYKETCFNRQLGLGHLQWSLHTLPILCSSI